MTLEDMRSYQPVIRPTVTTYYHGRKVTTCSNPTSGPVLASVLNILEQYNLRVQGFVDINLHRFIEALKFGFAFRTEMGDPDFTKNQERIDEIVTKEWASFVRRNISDVSLKWILSELYAIIHLFSRTPHMNLCTIIQSMTMSSPMELCIYPSWMRMTARWRLLRQST